MVKNSSVLELLLSNLSHNSVYYISLSANKNYP